MILVESSVWIELLSPKRSAHQQHLTELIRMPNTVGIPGPVIQEVLQGIEDGPLFHQVQERLEKFPIVQATTATYVHAAKLYRILAAKGTAVPSYDVMIAAIVIEAGQELYTLDHHFHRIAAHSPLRLYQPIFR